MSEQVSELFLLFSADQHLRELLLEKTSELQKLRADKDRLVKNSNLYAVFKYSHFSRTDKLCVELNRKLRTKEDTISTLTQEIDKQKSEVTTQKQRIMELTELLGQTVVKTRPVDLKHRMGEPSL